MGVWKGELLYAPWDEEEVAELNRYQSGGEMHPFTCACGAVLRATPEGWRCDRCPDYRQDWCHGWMATGPVRAFGMLREAAGDRWDGVDAFAVVITAGAPEERPA